MKSILQLLRQPIKTIAGILLVAFGVALLSVCVGQSIAAANTLNRINYSFTTIGLVDMNALQRRQSGMDVQSKSVPDDLRIWLDTAVPENNDILLEASPGLASAYVEGIAPLNRTQYILPSYGEDDYTLYSAAPVDAPYSCAMFEIVLDEIGEPYEVYNLEVLGDAGKQLEWLLTGGDGETELPFIGVCCELEGTIRSVVGLQEGYADPTGFTLQITLSLPSYEEWEALALSLGERYLVYGMDYFDEDWWLRSIISRQAGGELINYIYPEEIRYLSEAEIAERRKTNPYDKTVAIYSSQGMRYRLKENQAAVYHTATMSVINEGVMPLFEEQLQEDGTEIPALQTEYYYRDASGEKVYITQEEYRQRYAVPTIARLGGTVQEFLASEAGEIWRNALENMSINNQAFPIIGVEKLGYIPEFTMNNARVVTGRDFTPVELEKGAKVCIISESLAAANGLKVGDVIKPQFYSYDWSSPYQNYVHDGVGIVDPAAYYYTSSSVMQEEERYTIVGLYRQDNEWALGDNMSSFTSNTIFVPKTSVTSNMDYGDFGLFWTLVIENGALREFQRMVVEAGFEEYFLYYDQGYSVIAQSLYDYQAVGNRALLVGLVTFSALMLIFLFLFPAQQGTHLSIMSSIGATRKEKVRHILVSSLGIMIPGTIIGFIIGIGLWQEVVDALMASAEVILTLEMDVFILSAVAAVQFLLVTGLVLLLAVPMSKEKNLSQRR